MSNVTKFFTYSTDVTSNYFSGIWMMTRCMKQAGWIYKSSSNGTSVDTSGIAANDKWGGNATPTLDSYPTGFSSITGPWWNAQGPQVVKLFIPNGSPGSGLPFVPGELMTQATSTATGQLLGYVYDTTVSANGGWVIIMPQTGTFDGTHTVTGGTSGASITPSAVKFYSQEIVIWKNSSGAQQGSIYWIQADASAESTEFFSYLAANVAGVTATVAPGGGGTGNGFPTSAIAFMGYGGSSNPAYWSYSSTSSTHCLVSAVNATPAANVSADGTFWAMLTTVGGLPQGTNILGLFRLDDTEPGDVSPWVWGQATGANFTSYNQAQAQTTNGPNTTWANLFQETVYFFNGYAARGVGGTPGTQPDVGQGFGGGFPSDAQGNCRFTWNNSDVLLAQNHPALNKPLAVDTVTVWGVTSGIEMNKGRVRWMRMASTGSGFNTTDALTWVCFLQNSSDDDASVYVGPWDGVTIPGP